MRSVDYLSYILNPFEKRTKKILSVNPTLPPQRTEPDFVKISIYDYDAQSIHKDEVQKVPACFPYLESPKVTWINMDGLRKTDVEELCNYFGVHNLAIEDILSIGQRPKMDEYNNMIFCTLNMLYYNEKQYCVEAEQISIVLGKNFVLSFQEDAARDVFNPLREKLKINLSKVRQNGADFLFYTLLDMIVDNFYLVMDKLGERVETMEDDIIRYANTRSIVRLNNLRKEMIVLKRSVSPVRELINGILRSDTDLINEKTERYFKDIYDHVVQANDLVDNYRDMIMNLQDLYLGNVNQKTNEVMKVMAIVTCLLAPATVIGGIFGMNFDKLPYIHDRHGFFIAASLMLIIPVWMIYVFKKRGWF